MITATILADVLEYIKFIKEARRAKREKANQDAEEKAEFVHMEIRHVLLNAQGLGLTEEEIRKKLADAYDPKTISRVLIELRDRNLAFFMNGRWYAQNPVVGVDRFGR